MLPLASPLISNQINKNTTRFYRWRTSFSLHQVCYYYSTCVFQVDLQHSNITTAAVRILTGAEVSDEIKNITKQMSER